MKYMIAKFDSYAQRLMWEYFLVSKELHNVSHTNGGINNNLKYDVISPFLYVGFLKIKFANFRIVTMKMLLNLKFTLEDSLTLWCKLNNS